MGMNGQQPTAERMPNGALVRPGPIAFEVGVQATPDGTKWVTLRIETESGSFCKPLEAGMAKQLAETLREASEAAGTPLDLPPRSGLVLPD